MVLAALQRSTFQIEGKPYSDGRGERIVARALEEVAESVEEAVNRVAKVVVPVDTGFLRSTMAWHNSLVGSLTKGPTPKGVKFGSPAFGGGRITIHGKGTPRAQSDYYVARAIYAPHVEAHSGYMSQALGAGFGPMTGSVVLPLPYIQPIITNVRGAVSYVLTQKTDYVTVVFGRYLSLEHIWNQAQNAIHFQYPNHSPIQFDNSQGGYREQWAIGAAKFTPSPIRSDNPPNVRGGFGLLRLFIGAR